MHTRNRRLSSRTRRPGAARIAAALAVALAVALGALPAAATDNCCTPWHFYTFASEYRIHSSVPAAWRDSIQRGARYWKESRPGQYPGFDFANLDIPEVENNVFVGVWPVSVYPYCRPPDVVPGAVATLACAWWEADEWGHFIVTHIAFNVNLASWFRTDCPPLLSGWFDVFTVAKHEFGHWGHLAHTEDVTSAIVDPYAGCSSTASRTLHDELSSGEKWTAHVPHSICCGERRR